MSIFGINFWIVCWGFWRSLGLSWEPFWVSWGFFGRPLDPKNYKKNCGFFNVFENAFFLFFEDPVGCFGLILLLFVRSGANAGSKMGSKSGPKIGQIVGQKWYQKWSESAQNAWSKMGFKIKKIALTAPSQKAWAFKQRLLWEKKQKQSHNDSKMVQHCPNWLN